LKNELRLWKEVLERVDPVSWLAANTGFSSWKHQETFLRDAPMKTRVVRKSRQIGMTTAIAHEALWKAFNTKGSRILIVSPGLRQSLIPMDRIRATVAANRKLMSRVVSQNRIELRLNNGSSIVAMPNNPDRIRGYAASDIYLDEAAHFLNDEPVMRVLTPMLIARKGTLTVVSTPFGKRGLFWDQYKKAVDQKSSDCGIGVYDFFPSTISPLISEKDLDSEKTNLTDFEFKQEYCGEFLEQLDVYLPLDLIASCVDNDLEMCDKGDPSKEYFMGIDLAKQRDETVVILLENADKLIVRHISAWSQMNYTDQIGRIRRLAEFFKVRHSAIDQTGVGEAVLEYVEKVLPSVEGVKFTQQTKLELINSLRLALEQNKLVLPHDSKLIMQLNSQGYSFSAAGNMILHAPETNQAHDDYLWALALALHAAQRPRPGAVFVNW
jgi:phage FluMu gp28-like protein